MLTSPPTLNITNSYFANFIYEFNSFIKVGDFGGFIFVSNSIFENFNTCGAFIRNKRYIYQVPQDDTSAASNYNSRAINYQAQIYQEMIVSTNPFTSCSTAPGASSPCAAMVLDNNTFIDFGFLKTRQNYATWVDPSFGLQYYGTILDLQSYTGNIQFTGSTVQNNILMYTSCDAGYYLMQNQNLLTDNYPNLGTKTVAQIRSLIMITNYDDYALDIINNTFANNTGTKGIIYLDLLSKVPSQPTGGRVLIASNVFTLNAAFFDSNVIFIRARGPSTGSIYSIIPSNGNVFCSGYRFDSNIFYRNFGCQGSGGGVIKFECVESSQTSTQPNDAYTFSTLGIVVGGEYYAGINFGGYSTSYTSSTSYNGVSYTVDRNRNDFYSNIYTENYQTYSSGLITILGAPRNFFELETFTGNGEMAWDVTNQYGTQLMQTGTQEVAFSAMVSNSGINTASLTAGLVKVQRTAQFSITQTTFDTNWQMEPVYSSSRAQLLNFDEIYGEFIFDQNDVYNQRGMDNPYLLSVWSVSINAAPAQEQVASSLCLVKFAPTDMLIYSNFMNSGSKFINDSFYESPSNSDCPMFFDLSDPSTIYKATTISMNTVDFQNVDCYSCSRPQFSLTSQSTTLTGINFKTINQNSYNSGYKSTSPFIDFIIRQPYDGITETLTLDALTASNVYNGNGGRLFNFDYQSMTGQSTPTSTQILMENSNFQNIYADGNGALAQINAYEMMMSISNCQFSNIESGYFGQTPSFGGVFYITSLAQLTLSGVTATGFNAYQTTSSNGGGRFIYLNQNLPFTQSITGSTFTCSSSTYLNTTVYNDLSVHTFDEGSCFQFNTQTTALQVTVQSTTIQNCYTSYISAAIYLETSNTTKVLTLIDNNFQGNAALYGGSIYCSQCSHTFQRNTFSNNMAISGADIYIQTPQNSITFDSHQHSSAFAISNGGSIYYQDLTVLKVTTITFNKVTGTSSNYKNIYTDGNGGLIFISVVYALNINIDSSVFSNNTSKLAASHIYVDNTITDALNYIMTNTQVSSSQATNNAGYLYLANTATTSNIQIMSSSFTSISAGGNGGIFDIEAYNGNTVLISSSQINTAYGNNGGCFYILGTTTSFTVQSSSTITSCQSSANGGLAYISSGTTTSITVEGSSQIQSSYCNNDGGVFYSSISGVNTLTVSSSDIISSTANTGGGGVAYFDGSSNSITIQTGSTITNSQARSNGGVFNAYQNQALGTFTLLIQSSVVSYQQSTNGEGGLVYSNQGASSSINVDSSTTSNQYAGGNGGGFFSYCSGPQILYITSSTVLNSSSVQNGGVAFLQGSNIDAEITSSSSISKSAGANGGVLYGVSSSNTTLFISASTLSQSSVTQNGGVLYSQGGAMTNIEVTASASISTSNSNGQGGSFYASSTNNSYYMTGSTIISSTASNNGGICAFSGLLNYVYLSGCILESPTSQQAGGSFYLDGHDVAQIQVLGSSSITSGYAGTYGGFVYMCAVSQTITFDSSIFSGIKAGAEGGIIYSCSLMTSATYTVTNNKFLGFQSSSYGSFISVQGTSSPNITFTSSNNQFECINVAMWASWPTIYNSIITNLQNNVATMGGVFFFSPGVNGSVTATSNTYDQCYTTTAGSIYYLPSGFYLSDTGSYYTQNCGLQGQIYCDGCTADIVNCNFKDQVAREGSVLYLNNAGNVIFDGSYMTQGKSILDGGAVISTGTGVAKLLFENCPQNITYFQSYQDGGFIQIDNSQLVFQSSGCQWNDLYASDIGGFANGAAVQNFSVTGCSLINITCGSAGSFFSSSTLGFNFNISNCSIFCSPTFDYNLMYSEFASGIVNTGSLLAMANAGQIQSTSNVFENCYTATSGAVMQLNYSNFYDYNSSFISNGAHFGGAFYILSSNAVFNQSRFVNNYGNYGGTMYVTGNSTIVFDNVTIGGSTSFYDGGLIYADDTSGQDVIQFNFQGTTTISNLVSQRNGGGFFLDAQYSSITMSGTTTLSNATSSGSGGFLYAQKAESVSLSNVDFYNVSSSSSGSIIYGTFPTSYALDQSMFTCKGSPYTTNQPALGNQINDIGGAFFLANSKLISVNTITVDNCYIGDVGGAFYIENATLTDLGGSQYNYNAAIQGGQLNCKNCTLNIYDAVYSNNQGYDGGFLYASDEVSITFSNVAITNSYSANQGGMIYATETGSFPSSITFTNSVQFSNSMSGNQGGSFFIDHIDLSMFIQTQATLFNSSSQNMQGGVFFIMEMHELIIEGSGTTTYFQEFQVSQSQQGSFLWSNSSGTIFTFKNQSFSCSPVPYSYSTSDSNMWSPIAQNQQEQAFYIENAASVTSSNNTYQNCYAMDMGSIFYVTSTLTAPIPFTETGSTYQNNQATYGGAIYCDWCSLSISANTIFSNNYARQGGAIYIRDASPTTITNAQFQNNYAMDQGGVIAINSKVGSIQPAVNMSLSSSTFANQETLRYQFSIADSGTGEGGGVYVNSKQLQDLTLDNVIFTNSYSSLSGGIVYINYLNGTLLVNNSQFYNFSAPNYGLGSMLYSVAQNTIFIIQNSKVQCRNTYDSSVITSSLSSLTSAYAGAIYFKSSIIGMTSLSNTYQYCYDINNGAVIYIEDSTLDERYSTFQQNSAITGGAIRCVGSTTSINSSVSVYNSYFLNNQAQSGGAFDIENSCTLTIDYSFFNQNTATSEGGIITVQDSVSNILPIQTILIKNCREFNGAYANMGGIFYVNHPYMNIVVQNVTMSGQSANTSAAIAYITRGNQFNITDSTVSDFVATETTFLYSSSPDLSINILRTTVTCNTSYNYDSVLAQLLQGNYNYQAQNTIYLSGSGSIYSEQNTFTQCGVLYQGGVFTINGNVALTDKNSKFLYNTAIYGGVISCAQGSVTLTNSNFTYNLAFKSGAIQLESQANMTANMVSFYYNRAMTVGGVIVVLTDSFFSLLSCDFYYNQANQSSAIDALGSSLTQNLQISLSTFSQNTAYENTISINTGNADIQTTQFTNNVASTKSKNIFLAFATVTLLQCTFSSPLTKNPEKAAANDGTMGAFLNIILDVNITIDQTYFVDGISYSGGAIYIQGSSDILITNCFFINNFAFYSGGAIYANGFNNVLIDQSSQFTNNRALQYGDDFYLTNSLNNFTIKSTVISSNQAMTSTYADGISLWVLDTTYKDIYENAKSQQGAAIQCLNCRQMYISNVVFQNIRSQVGGAIYVLDSTLNKLSTDPINKYAVYNSVFQNITAFAGGAIYFSSPHYSVVENSFFNYCRALNVTYVTLAGSEVGTAGSIYYFCSASDPACSLNISNSSFSQGWAQAKGGAIHWNYYEPNMDNLNFVDTQAGLYGDNISCYAQQLSVVSISVYQNQQERVFNTWMDQRTLDEPSSVFRSLQASNQSNYQQYVDQSQRSGGTIPDFYLALVDMYGQIVGDDFSSSIRVSVDTNYYVKNNNTDTYTPVLEGNQLFTDYGGITAVQGLVFTGAPGYEYKLQFTSTGIDETLPENIKFMNSANVTSLSFNFYIQLRDCIRGEYFTAAGKCILCAADQGYSLVLMTNPGNCVPCPTQEAYCEGGANIAPRPGFWRSSNTSSNFIQCYNPSACLGWYPLTPNEYYPNGQCAPGYYGVLCAACETGFSSQSNFKCAKCPNMASNIVIFMVVIIVVILALVMMVRSTLAGALEKKNAVSIYIKILMNHLQLILLVSSFNFQWPSQIQSLFSSTAPAASASTQVFSIDCFLQSNMTGGGSMFNSFFLKLLFFAMLPIILAASSYGFWFAYKQLKKAAFQSDKAISTLVITLFIIHPNLVQFMFNDFNCKNIDGTQRIYLDLEIVCWSSLHTFWSFSVALPAIVVWGLGIPAFAFYLMTKEKSKLNTIETRMKFGFLYNGYKLDYYYWEVIIMYRKIILIFISVFIQNYGVMVQALIVFMVLIIFLLLALKKKPFFLVSLNDLESLSLITSILSIYCGIFFIANVPSKYQSDIPAEVVGTIDLTNGADLFFFFVILASNLVFFFYWVFKLLNEIRVMILKKYEKIYICLFLCFDKSQLSRHKSQMMLEEENELLRDNYMKSIKKLKMLYDSGRLVLTQHILEKFQHYIDEERVLDMLGQRRRDSLNSKDMKRQQRQLNVEQVKDIQKQKEKVEAATVVIKSAPVIIDGNDQLEVDEEFVEIGAKRDDYAEMALRMEENNRLTSFNQTTSSKFLNTNLSQNDKYDNNLDIDRFNDRPMTQNLQFKVKKKLQVKDSEASNSDKDIWNEEKVKKNNYLLGDLEGKADIKSYIKKGDIDQQVRRKKNKKGVKNKEIEEIDKSKIARKDLKQKALNKLQRQKQNKVKMVENMDKDGRLYIQEVNEDELISGDKIERELVMNVDKRNSSATDDEDIQTQIKRMEREVDGGDSDSSEDFQVFSDDDAETKKQAYTAKTQLNYEEMIQRKKHKR